MTRHCSVLLATALLGAATTHAQDRRAVTEPAAPPLCRSLDAALTTAGDGLADIDDNRPDTARIQQAIDQCQAGTAVELRTNGSRTAFLTGPLELREGVTLLVSRGAVVFASRNPRDYDIKPGTCGTIDNSGIGCRPLIRVNVHGAALMGEGVIDGRGGATLTAHEVSWWDLAEQARTNRVRVETPGHNAPHLLEADRADGLVLFRITLRNSPHFNVLVRRTDGCTIWGVRINSPTWARNTDGIDPSSSTNVSILHSYINVGDDHVAIKAGADGPSTHITIGHNHFYAGHGMSIGSGTSGGVSDVEVRDLTIVDALHGLHIKSSPNRGGLVRRISYSDVCMQDVTNPINFETTYKGVTAGTLIPRYENILLRDVRISGGGNLSFNGFDAAHPLRVTLDGITATPSPAVQVHAKNARITTGPGQVKFSAAGEDVAIRRVAGTRTVTPCNRPFLPFPDVATASSR